MQFYQVSNVVHVCFFYSNKQIITFTLKGLEHLDPPIASEPKGVSLVSH
jgi:hypothetical protein